MSEKYWVIRSPTIREMRLVIDECETGARREVQLDLARDVDGKTGCVNLSGIPRALKSHPTDESTYWILLETTKGFVAVTYHVLDRQCSFVPYTLEKWKKLLDSVVLDERPFNGKRKR